MKPRFTSLAPRRLLALIPALTLFAAVVSGMSSCGGEDPVPAGVNTGAPATGTQAELCDDGNPHPGCECASSQDGTRAVCGKVTSQLGGQIVCGYGDMVCEQGQWGECIINNTIKLHPGADTMSLGAPQACQDNPCDPYCGTFVDTPDGLTGDGIVADGSGVTLPGGEGSSDPNECTDGPSGDCAHSICVAGAPLDPGCDATDPPAPPPPPGSGEVTYWLEEFENNNKGWSLGPEWQIAGAQKSFGGWGNGDPATDTSPGNNNGVAGIVIGGNASTSLHKYEWLTSPPINTAAAGNPVKLRFKRFLNSDYAPWMYNRIQIFNGSSWVTLQNINYGPTDNAWVDHEYDVSSYKNANMRVRFGMRIAKNGAFTTGSWNVDDVEVLAAGPPPPPPPPPPSPDSCVEAICDANPFCCTTAWSSACVAMVATVCGAQCVNVDGTCYACFEDNIDHDGDGTSYQEGDCLDCDPNVGPGAYDYPGNGVDEDCDGVIDNEPTDCDGGIPLSSANPWAHANAIDLCRTPGDPGNPAPQAYKGWGVTKAKLVQADGVSNPHALGRGIHYKFGPNNLPKEGTRMAAYSSGTARAPGDPGYVPPDGAMGTYYSGNSCAYPAGFPKNKAGCSQGGGLANDSSGLKLSIKVPTNAKAFSYQFNFFSSEYPEWVCTYYNDHFVAILDTLDPSNPAANDKNISFDSQGSPVSVNVGLFTEPGCATCVSPALTGTGFDGFCYWGETCGGATNWLTTTAPVVPGEEIDIHFTIWDQGDAAWDSTVLIDNFKWSVEESEIATFKDDNPEPPPTEFEDGYFVRDYDLSSYCASNETIRWSLWSWQADTPSDSRIDFSVATSDTEGGLDMASEYKLQFSDPPGPSMLVGQDAKASAMPTDTQNGSLDVDATLYDESVDRTLPYLRITSHLIPSTDKLFAPTLESWNLTFDCLPGE